MDKFIPGSSPICSDAPDDDTAAVEAAKLKAKRKEDFFKFFAGHKKKPKLSRSEKIVAGVQIHPILCSPATPAAVKRIGKPEDLKYQKYISMSEDGLKLRPPPPGDD